MNDVTPIYFELEKGVDGNFYVVITAIPKGDRSLRRQLKKEHLVYSRPGVDSATTSNGSAVSRHASNNVGAEQDVLPTSDKQGVCSVSSISQGQQEVTQENSETKQEKFEGKQEPAQESQFGDEAENEKDFLDALGITEDETEEVSFGNEFGDTTDEEIEVLKKEL